MERNIVHTSNPFRNINSNTKSSRGIYYGEVMSTDDSTDGGRIIVRILDLDSNIANNSLPWCYPLLPKFFHLYPMVGEMVRVFIEDIRSPQRSRFWIGSVISQMQKIEYDGYYTALSTTNIGNIKPLESVSSYPTSEGVFPKKNEIGLVGRVNTDVILKDNEVQIRAGKHENGNVLKLNTLNPASINLVFEQKSDSQDFYSSNILMGDKIALISHKGTPKFKSNTLSAADRERIFEEGHPIARGDVLVAVLNIIRDALINHIHGYSSLPAAKTTMIKVLEDLDLTKILQKDIVTN